MRVESGPVPLFASPPLQYFFFYFSSPPTHQCCPGWSSGQGSIGYSIGREGGQLGKIFLKSYIYMAQISVPSTFATVEGNCPCTVFCIFINVQYGYPYHLSYFSHWKLWNLINSWFALSINFNWDSEANTF